MFDVAAGILLAGLTYFLFNLGFSLAAEKNPIVSGGQKFLGWFLCFLSVLLGLLIFGLAVD